MLNPTNVLYQRETEFSAVFEAHGAQAKIIESIPTGSRVLDVGCGPGNLDAALKRKGCYLVGVEVDERLADLARRTCDEVVNANVETADPLPFPQSFFDVLLFADSLEHMVRPDLVLKGTRKYLTTKGIVVISIPNIARIDIRLMLLRGRFDYKEAGILDRTHLRFFTLDSLQKLLDECSLKIQEVKFTGLASRLRVLPKVLTGQFVIVASYF